MTITQLENLKKDSYDLITYAKKLEKQGLVERAKAILEKHTTSETINP